MLNKKVILTTMALACMSVASTSFASEHIVKDAAGQLHFRPSAESHSIMKAEDISKDGIWVVPADQVGKMNFTPRPVHEVMDMTEEEYEEWCRQSNGGGDSEPAGDAE